MLSIRNAVWDAGRGVRHLDDLSLDVHQGEILGIAGVEGNGQRPLGDLLSSLVTLTSGDVVVDGKKVDSARPGAMAQAAWLWCPRIDTILASSSTCRSPKIFSSAIPKELQGKASSAAPR